IRKIGQLPLSPHVPTEPLPHMHMTHERARMDQSGITHIHHFFLPRQAQALGRLWGKAATESDTRLRNALLFAVEQAIWTMSLANSYRPTGFSQVSQYFKGVYYIPSQNAE